MVLLLGAVVTHTHCRVARGGVGEYRAAGLVRFQGEVQVGGGGMNRPAPSRTLIAQGGVQGHRSA